MADGTHISWAEATWNPITGCSVVSPGCKRCYAMRLAGTRMRYHWSREGLTRDTPAGPVWTGEVRFNEPWLDRPLHWRKPRMIFVCAHADLFHEAVPDEWIDRVFAVMALAPQHVFMVLTKRATRMREYICSQRDKPRFLRFNDHELSWTMYESGVPTHIWLGVSVEDQRHADERIPELLATPAVLHWISAEPLLGPIAAGRWMHDSDCHARMDREWLDPFCTCSEPREAHIGWVVAGGESQNSDRPSHPAWFCSLRDQCSAASVPFHFKQWGDWRPPIGYLARPMIAACSTADCAWPDGTMVPGTAKEHGGLGYFMQKVGAKAAGRTLDGRIWDEFPARPR